MEDEFGLTRSTLVKCGEGDMAVDGGEIWSKWHSLEMMAASSSMILMTLFGRKSEWCWRGTYSPFLYFFVNRRPRLFHNVISSSVCAKSRI